jgi:WD40 repeat protein
VRLTPSAFETLFAALSDAFTDQGEFELLSRAALDRNLSDIVAHSARNPEIVQALITAAETADAVEQLVTSAKSLNPTNVQLREIDPARLAQDLELPAGTSLVSGESALMLRGHREAVWDAAWSPSGELVATGCGDEATRIWEASSGRLRSILADVGPVYRLAWSPDGTRIATAGQGGRLTVHDVATSRTITSFRAPYLLVRGASWTPDGLRVATATGTNIVAIVSATTGEALVTLDLPAEDLAYSQTGEWLAVAGDAGVTLLDRDFQRSELASARVSAITWKGDGASLGGMTGSGCHIWSVPDGDVVSVIPYGSSGRPAWSADGLLVAVPAENDIIVWDMEKSAPTAVLSGHTRDVRAVGWSPDGTRVISAGLDGTARIWTLP